MDMGVDFDRDASGELVLGREGGHKANRIIHFQDVTGLNISRTLLEKVKALPNVALLSHHVALDLIMEEDTSNGAGLQVCRGASVLDLKTNSLEDYRAGMTVLATGGVGQVYRVTTNPAIATGDGIAMAQRAGARISNMAYVQFHPTALFDSNSHPAFLISEAVRGHGAFLRNSKGERFMFDYHIDGELACRDVVSRAIANEMRRNNEPCVFLDCTHLPLQDLLNRFPNIYKKCTSVGIDIARDFIPVVPAAHYLCGGIDVNLDSATSIENLYACGECSNTGLHGANRLASNSLLEATVFAHNCFLDIERRMDPVAGAPSTHALMPQSAIVEEKIFGVAEKKRALQDLMNDYAGIVRTTRGLQYALSQLGIWEIEFFGNGRSVGTDPDAYELKNMIACAQLIVKQSLEQTQNRGGFFNADLEEEKLEKQPLTQRFTPA
jgi:L-aspartate oxidase